MEYSIEELNNRIILRLVEARGVYGDIIQISLCDKVHSARAILWDYKYVGEKLWDRFKGKRNGTLWYYRALVEAFRSRGFSRLFEEFESTVSQIEDMAAEASKKPPKSKSLKKTN
jgi:hypothetical protein